MASNSDWLLLSHIAHCLLSSVFVRRRLFELGVDIVRRNLDPVVILSGLGHHLAHLELLIGVEPASHNLQLLLSLFAEAVQLHVKVRGLKNVID